MGSQSCKFVCRPLTVKEFHGLELLHVILRTERLHVLHAEVMQGIWCASFVSNPPDTHMAIGVDLVHILYVYHYTHLSGQAWSNPLLNDMSTNRQAFSHLE